VARFLVRGGCTALDFAGVRRLLSEVEAAGAAKDNGGQDGGRKT